MSVPRDFLGYFAPNEISTSFTGRARENHLEGIFAACELRCERTALTEGRSKPDFLFPGSQQYRNPEYDPLLLTMLGVKSTCKDRWRQVLAEARRIDNKHLLTLETAISPPQTDEMRVHRLQLVLPKGLHKTYTQAQQNWLWDLATFNAMVREKQGRAGAA